jgi:hypothetical protein
MRPKTKSRPHRDARSRAARKERSLALHRVDLDDDALLEIVQEQTLRYFWNFAHPMSGLARERSNLRPEYGLEVVTTGGSGFGVMAIIVGVARGWIDRAEAVERLPDDGAFSAEGRQLPWNPAALPAWRYWQDGSLHQER